MFTTTGSMLQSGAHRIEVLREEITALEQRLHLMGMDGDCAYERAISKLYLTMVEEKRRQLGDLRVSPA